MGRLAQAVMRSAERRTGLGEWGDLEFVPRMEAWLAAAAGDRGLNDVGRANLDAFASRYARNRLHLEDLILRHPEIETIPLPRPIVVTGLPRSGTTALARLLSDSSAVRWLPYWEAMEPFSADSVALRRQRAGQEADATGEYMPLLQRFHQAEPDSFTDDQELQGLAFGSYMLEWQAHVPDWRDHYLAEDQASVYRYLKRAMQALTFLRAPVRWVIKSPQHLEQLAALRTVFPDAILVVSIRDRAAVDASMARLIGYVAEHTRTRAVPFRYWPARFDAMQERYEATKALFPDRVEVRLDEWTKDASALRERIHALAGLNLQPRAATS